MFGTHIHTNCNGCEVCQGQSALVINFHVWILCLELTFTQIVTVEFFRVSLPSSLIFDVWMLCLELAFTQITCNCGVLQGQSALVMSRLNAMFGTHILTQIVKAVERANPRCCTHRHLMLVAEV